MWPWKCDSPPVTNIYLQPWPLSRAFRRKLWISTDTYNTSGGIYLFRDIDYIGIFYCYANYNCYWLVHVFMFYFSNKIRNYLRGGNYSCVHLGLRSSITKQWLQYSRWPIQLLELTHSSFLDIITWLCKKYTQVQHTHGDFKGRPWPLVLPAPLTHTWPQSRSLASSYFTFFIALNTLWDNIPFSLSSSLTHSIFSSIYLLKPPTKI